MGALSKTFRNAKNFVGRSWGHTKQILHKAKDTIDSGVAIYSKLQPVINEGVQAFGNQRVKDFSRKAQEVVEGQAKRGQGFLKEVSSNVDKIDDLGGQFMGAFR